MVLRSFGPGFSLSRLNARHCRERVQSVVTVCDLFRNLPRNAWICWVAFQFHSEQFYFARCSVQLVVLRGPKRPGAEADVDFYQLLAKRFARQVAWRKLHHKTPQKHIAALQSSLRLVKLGSTSRNTSSNDNVSRHRSRSTLNDVPVISTRENSFKTMM